MVNHAQNGQEAIFLVDTWEALVSFAYDTYNHLYNMSNPRR